jgi:hypothetical protein
MRFRVSTVAGALALAGLVACQSSVGPEAGWRRALGFIDAAASMPPLRLPASARAGEPAVLTVTTFGSSSCTRPNGVEVRVSALTADLTAYDWVPADPNTVCTRDLHHFPREVTVRFAAPGEATIRLHGRGAGAAPAVVEGRLRVEP